MKSLQKQLVLSSNGFEGYDCDSVPKAQSFDAVTFIPTLDDARTLGNRLSECNRVLKDGGVLNVELGKGCHVSRDVLEGALIIYGFEVVSCEGSFIKARKRKE